MTVFDFPLILERTERRVRDDLLGSGPKTVDELRSVAGRLGLKYKAQLDRKITRAKQEQDRSEAVAKGPKLTEGVTPQQKVTEVMSQAGNMAGGLFSKIKPPTIQIPGIPRKADGKQPPPPTASPTIVALPPAPSPSLSSMGVEGDWLGTDIPPVTDAISNFSIGDDDDDDDL